MYGSCAGVVTRGLWDYGMLAFQAELQRKSHISDKKKRWAKEH
jgi:hypothetical protein